MPAITTNDLKNGITLQLDNGLFTVVEFQHVKPGKGGAFVRTKLRNLKNGNVLEKTLLTLSPEFKGTVFQVLANQQHWRLAKSSKFPCLSTLATK